MLQRIRIEPLWWLLPAAAAVIAAAQRNFAVIAQPPYYDEMWRLNIATAPNPIARLLAFETPTPPGWLFLNKLLLYATPENIALGRAVSLLWVASAASLLLAIVPPERRDWTLLLAAGFVAVSATIGEVARNFNQYSLEIFFSVALVAIAATPLTTPWRRFAASAVIVLTPIATIASCFFLPGALLARFALAPSRRDRIGLALVAVATLALAVAIYVQLYRPIVIQNGGPLLAYWTEYNVRHDLPKLLSILARFPEHITRSVLGDLPAGEPQRALMIVFVLLVIAAGWLALAARARAAAFAIAAGILTAIAFSYLTSWPLSLGELRRVNIGWAWAFYFLFALGLCEILRRLLVLLLRRRVAACVGSCVALLCFYALTGASAFARYVPDKTPLRGLYREIAATLGRPDPPQAIVQFFFTGHCYAEFLARVKTANRVALLLEPRADAAARDAFLRSITEGMEQRSEIRQLVMFVPVNTRPLNEVEQIAVRGFRRTELRSSNETHVLRFDRVGR